MMHFLMAKSLNIRLNFLGSLISFLMSVPQGNLNLSKGEAIKIIIRIRYSKKPQRFEIINNLINSIKKDYPIPFELKKKLKKDIPSLVLLNYFLDQKYYYNTKNESVISKVSFLNSMVSKIQTVCHRAKNAKAFWEFVKNVIRYFNNPSQYQLLHNFFSSITRSADEMKFLLSFTDQNILYSPEYIQEYSEPSESRDDYITFLHLMGIDTTPIDNRYQYKKPKVTKPLKSYFTIREDFDELSDLPVISHSYHDESFLMESSKSSNSTAFIDLIINRRYSNTPKEPISTATPNSSQTTKRSSSVENLDDVNKKENEELNSKISYDRNNYLFYSSKATELLHDQEYKMELLELSFFDLRNHFCFSNEVMTKIVSEIDFKPYLRAKPRIRLRNNKGNSKFLLPILGNVPNTNPSIDNNNNNNSSSFHNNNSINGFHNSNSNFINNKNTNDNNKDILYNNINNADNNDFSEGTVNDDIDADSLKNKDEDDSKSSTIKTRDDDIFNDDDSEDCSNKLRKPLQPFFMQDHWRVYRMLGIVYGKKQSPPAERIFRSTYNNGQRKGPTDPIVNVDISNKVEKIMRHIFIQMVKMKSSWYRSQCKAFCDYCFAQPRNFPHPEYCELSIPYIENLNCKTAVDTANFLSKFTNVITSTYYNYDNRVLNGESPNKILMDKYSIELLTIFSEYYKAFICYHFYQNFTRPPFLLLDAATKWKDLYFCEMKETIGRANIEENDELTKMFYNEEIKNIIKYAGTILVKKECRLQSAAPALVVATFVKECDGCGDNLEDCVTVKVVPANRKNMVGIKMNIFEPKSEKNNLESPKKQSKSRKPKKANEYREKKK